MVCSLSSVGRVFHEQAVMSRVLLGRVDEEGEGFFWEECAGQFGTVRGETSVQCRRFYTTPINGRERESCDVTCLPRHWAGRAIDTQIK